MIFNTSVNERQADYHDIHDHMVLSTIFIKRVPRNLQQDRSWTDPGKTWVSNSSIATYLGVRS